MSHRLREEKNMAESNFNPFSSRKLIFPPPPPTASQAPTTRTRTLSRHRTHRRRRPRSGKWTRACRARASPSRWTENNQSRNKKTRLLIERKKTDWSFLLSSSDKRNRFLSLRIRFSIFSFAFDWTVQDVKLYRSSGLQGCFHRDLWLGLVGSSSRMLLL